MSYLVKITLIVILFLLSLLYLHLIFNNNIFEQINEINSHYMNKNELYEYLIKDSDNYFKNFSQIDLKVRKINNIEEYYQNIKKSCIDINNNMKIVLNNCINKANIKLSNYKCKGFDGSKCANIIWKIGIVKDSSYEEGFPHTRNDVIILPLYLLNNKESLVKTLIHEKIHVYQKIYPKDIEEYLIENGFTKYELRNNFNNTRANPDMDEWIYKNKDNQIMIAEYNKNASSIMDVNIQPNNTSKYEHPFEYMAYDITNNINAYVIM